MKSYSIIGIIFSSFYLLNCYPPSWIRELPTSEQTVADVQLQGLYEKRLPPYSPYTSVLYRENHSENLRFDKATKSFRKFYTREIEEKGLVQKFRVVGEGKYRSKGNWVLLTTEKIESEESVWKNGQQISGTGVNTVASSHKLLYHYDASSDSLIPMINETGYREKAFGVVDGTQTPYAEDELFRLSRRNYTLKEYQGHAYFRSK
ncbi:hypothetical protein EHQ53_02750 [Leptospira langatensis]|uniref:Uncharacterized protein n=1 Tax=Leptospira langatensis TaxID=2484983 RepID=A0A5F2A0U3_9LEPT|nr:hypothetical protein EHO57_02980 [Leptospira langatensis]TGL43839.1 hypothetical protein EHQ53_02750 [Leptospira langatensis]